MIISAITAVSKNGVIHSIDFSLLDEITNQSAIIFDEETFWALYKFRGDVLPNRVNFVVSDKGKVDFPEGAIVAKSLSIALHTCIVRQEPEAFICQRSYKRQIIEHIVTKIYLEMIDLDIRLGDDEDFSLFPEIDENEWEIENSIARVRIYVRK